MCVSAAWIFDFRGVNCKEVIGVPRRGDRFVLYGIKVSFWASGTLKIVIHAENCSQNEVFGWIIVPLGGWGVN